VASEETPINVTLTLDSLERSMMGHGTQAWSAAREHRVQVEYAVRSAIGYALAAERARVVAIINELPSQHPLNAIHREALAFALRAIETSPTGATPHG
jgi:hypothetical protein